ncbi:MAG: hypothetical protein QXF26_05215 [Candidatus Bathyarchaeia archaeon]
MSEAKPYFYVRYSWSCQDLDKVFVKVKEKFNVVWHHMPKDGYEVLTYPRDELKVEADTLNARLGAYSAVLFQKKKAPFTPRDMELRRIVLELYSHSRPTPIPWHLSQEPKFEVAEDTEKET